MSERSTEGKLKVILQKFSVFEELYIDSLNDLDLELDLVDDTFCSGWVCMLFMLSLPAKLKEVRRKIDWNEVYDKNIAYIKLYLLVDHFMDSPSTSDQAKAALIRWLLDENRVATEEIHHKILAPFQLLTQTENDRKNMKQLIKVTVEGIKFQRKKSASYEEYLRVAVDKGGYTVLVGARLIYGDVLDVLTDEELLFLGGATQLLDDMIDTSEDLEGGINTVCTYVSKVDGNVDRVAMELSSMLKQLPEHFSHYRKAMDYAMRYVVTKSKHYSYLTKCQIGAGLNLPVKGGLAYKRREEKKFRKMYMKGRGCKDCGKKCASCGK